MHYRDLPADPAQGADPSGHVLLQFASLRELEGAADALMRLGVALERMALRTPLQVLRRIRAMRHDALMALGGPIGPNAHRAAAEQGRHWLLVPADDIAEARRVAGAARGWRAERAQYHAPSGIEELLPQAALSRPPMSLPALALPAR